MKYWVFQNNQVTGPFDPEDLSQVSGYSGDTLICPEGRKGTNMGDWQRASLVPELSVSILKASQLALAVKSGGYPALPPEPTLKDLAALGSLQEKVSVLDNMVGHLQESLRLKDDELLSVHKELQEKARYAQDLSVKLGTLEERLVAVNALREGLDKAVAAEHDVESTVRKQAVLIEELRTQLDALREEEKSKVSELESELARVKADDEKAREQLSQRLADASAAAADASAAAADAAAKAQAAKEEAEKAEAKARDAAANAVPAPVPAAAPMPALTTAPGPALTPAPAAAVEPAPFPAPAPADAPPPAFPPAAGRSDVNAALGLASERPADKPASTAPPAPLGDPAWMQPAPLSSLPSAAGMEGLKPLGLETPLAEPLSPMPLTPALGSEPASLGAPSASGPSPAPAPTAAPAPLAGAPAGKPAAKPKKSAPLALVAVVVVGAAALGALKVLGPGQRRASAPVSPEPAPLPPAPEPPKPSPEEILEQQKQQAIQTLRSWPLPDGTQVAVKLETEPTPPGGLSPWFADKIREGLFQVNFYPPKGSKKAGQSYEFEVSLDEHKVEGHNPAAAALLAGKPAKPAKGRAVAKSKAKIKIKPKTTPDDSGDVLGEALNLDDSSSPAPQAPASGGGDVLIDGSGSEAQAAAAPSKRRPAARRSAKPAAAPADDPLASLVGDEKPKAARLPKPAAKQESLDDLLLPGVPKERPTAPTHMEEAPSSRDAEADDEPEAKPSRSSGKKKSRPADAALLEDLLKP